MKIVLFAAAILCLTTSAFAQTANKDYDAELAKRLGGNDNGMKRYVLVILKSGGNTTAEKSVTDEAFKGHMKNMDRLADEGKLVLASPLGKNEKSYRGIFIMNVETVDAARELVLTDPAVKANLLDAEYYPLFGSAAIQETVNIHKKIQKFQ